MKHLNKFLLPVAALGISLMASCDIKDVVPEEPEVPQTTTPTAPTPPSPTVSGTWGGLVALKMTLTYSQMGYNVDVNTEMGVGSFYTAMGSGTMVDAGVVKLNNIALDKNANHSYSKVASIGMTPDDMDIDNGVNWSVAGGSGIPSFTYTHTGGFPSFSGTIPETITRANGMTLTLNGTTVSNADSVYVFFVSGSTSLLKSYAANAGPITISGSDLNGLAASSTTSPAYVEVIPWKYTLQEVGTTAKLVAFIKENAIVKSVTIN